MVQAPFNGLAGTGAPERQKMARATLRTEMRTGRGTWLAKLAACQSVSPRLPRLLVKVAYPGMGYPEQGFGYQQPGWGNQQGWPMQPQFGGGYPHAPGLTPPGLAPASHPGAPFAASPAVSALHQQMQAHQQFLNQALMAGQVSPRRYQQLMSQMQQRQNFLQQQGQWPGAGQHQEGPAADGSLPASSASAEQEQQQAAPASKVEAGPTTPAQNYNELAPASPGAAKPPATSLVAGQEGTTVPPDYANLAKEASPARPSAGEGKPTPGAGAGEGKADVPQAQNYGDLASGATSAQRSSPSGEGKPGLVNLPPLPRMVHPPAVGGEDKPSLVQTGSGEGKPSTARVDPQTLNAARIAAQKRNAGEPKSFPWSMTPIVPLRTRARVKVS